MLGAFLFLSFCYMGLQNKDPGATKFSKSSLTTATYSYKMTAAKSGRQVYCVVKDSYGNTDKSEVVTLSMITIKTQPATKYAKLKATVSTKVMAEGEGLTYTWYMKEPDGTGYKKSSITKSTYSYTMTTAKDGRKVYCVIKDKYGNTVKTDTVSLNAAASITKQPVSAAAAKGDTVKATVKAYGDGLTYTWYYKDPGSTKFVKSSTTKSTYSFTMTAAKDGRQVYCVVKDSHGNSVQSKTVTLTME